jgi:hypothetical protein
MEAAGSSETFVTTPHHVLEIRKSLRVFVFTNEMRPSLGTVDWLYKIHTHKSMFSPGPDVSRSYQSTAEV